jgi:hypothetical protein
MLGPQQIERCKLAVIALLDAGMKETFLPLAIAQIAHETAGFNSKVAITCNNLSGIKYIAKPYQIATACTNSPEGNNYARFANYTDWAKDYIRILSMGYKPINAKDVTDFAYRLKQNNYYTDSVANYKAGLNAWINKFSDAIAESKKKYFNHVKESINNHSSLTGDSRNIYNVQNK